MWWMMDNDDAMVLLLMNVHHWPSVRAGLVCQTHSILVPICPGAHQPFRYSAVPNRGHPKTLTTFQPPRGYNPTLIHSRPLQERASFFALYNDNQRIRQSHTHTHTRHRACVCQLHDKSCGMTNGHRCGRFGGKGLLLLRSWAVGTAALGRGHQPPRRVPMSRLPRWLQGKVGPYSLPHTHKSQPLWEVAASSVNVQEISCPKAWASVQVVPEVRHRHESPPTAPPPPPPLPWPRQQAAGHDPIQQLPACLRAERAKK